MLLSSNELMAMLEISTAIESLTLGCGFHHVDLLTLLGKTASLSKLLLHGEMPVPGIVFEMMRYGELIPNLDHLVCTKTSPHSLLDLLEQQCTHHDLPGHRGLYLADITCRGHRVMDGVHRRLWALKPQLQDNHKTITVAEESI